MKNKFICSSLLRDIDSKFLINVSYLNESNYKVVFNFFGFSFTRESYLKLLGKNHIKGFNNGFNIFLCPVDREFLNITKDLNSLYLKQSKEEFFINTVIINNRIVNIYNENDYFLKLIKDTKSSLFTLNQFLNSFLIFQLRIHLNFIFIILNFLKNIKIL